MNYTIASIKYILKNFWYILPFSILPALFLSLSIDKFAIQKVLTDYFTGKPGGSFPIIFRAISIFNFRDVGAFFAGLAGIVLMVVCVSLMLALIEKHMRIGKRTYNGIFSKLNDNLLSTCGICLFYVLIYEVWAVLISALLFLAYLVENVVAVYILSVIIFFSMHFVLLYVVSLFYLWLPCLQITGFRAFEAAPLLLSAGGARENEDRVRAVDQRDDFGNFDRADGDFRAHERVFLRGGRGAVYVYDRDVLRAYAGGVFRPCPAGARRPEKVLPLLSRHGTNFK